MKKLLITAAAGLACVGAFGQGTLTFANNTDNLIYFTTSANGMFAADAAATFINPVSGNPNSVLGSTVAPDGSIAALSGAPTFTAYLYGGTSAGSLSLQTTTTIDTWADGSPGQIVALNTTFNGPGGSASLPAGTPAFFQVVIADRATPLASADPVGPAWNTGFYGGASSVFQASPVALLGNLYSPGAPINSTWAPGTFTALTDLVDAAGPGAGIGGIMVSTQVPEPGTFALAGLGLAALLVLRRRNS
jgi:hypothetical protein